jgi:hypothetical protein
VSESDRTPRIHLEVNQEVFLDVVRDGDVIEDATVATEVTSFERIGDAYVLEGAIVFAGYIQRDEETQVAEEGPLVVEDILGFHPDEGYVEHVHYRMPFVFRVPVRAQARGVVNVTSRISSWKLEVVSAGWVRVLADLAIYGLNPQQGYHFHCGAQEEGDVLFGLAADDDPVSGAGVADEVRLDVAIDADEAGRSEITEAEDEFALVRGRKREVNTADAVNFARGGVDPGGSAAVPPEGDGADSSLPGELRRYDRAFAGEDDALSEQITKAADPHAMIDAGAAEAREPQTEAIEADDRDERASPRKGVHRVSSEAVSVDGVSPFGAEAEFGAEADEGGQSGDSPRAVDGRDEAVDEFEFEHQVSADEMRQPYASVPSPETFSAARAFTEEGFQAGAGFSPKVTYGSRADGGRGSADRLRMEPGVAGDEDLDARVDAEESAGERWSPETEQGRGESSKAPVSDMWSFVDFSAPERTYTLRFAIVVEDESVDSLAERLGCSKQELLRLNRLSSETALYAGQTLLIPYH